MEEMKRSGRCDRTLSGSGEAQVECLGSALKRKTEKRRRGRSETTSHIKEDIKRQSRIFSRWSKGRLSLLLICSVRLRCSHTSASLQSCSTPFQTFLMIQSQESGILYPVDTATCQWPEVYCTSETSAGHVTALPTMRRFYDVWSPQLTKRVANHAAAEAQRWGRIQPYVVPGG
jgi:hypothetical protein